MKDLVSVVGAIVKGAKSLMQQLMFSLYAPLPCLNSMITLHMLFILLAIIKLTHSKNRKAITKEGAV